MSRLHQLFDLGGAHVDEGLGEREDVAHAHADECVAVGVLAFAGLEVALDLPQLVVGLEGLELIDEFPCGEVFRVGGLYRRDAAAGLDFAAGFFAMPSP